MTISIIIRDSIHINSICLKNTILLLYFAKIVWSVVFLVRSFSVLQAQNGTNTTVSHPLSNTLNTKETGKPETLLFQIFVLLR